MRLTLVDDEGVVIDSWYLPEEETTAEKVKSHIEGELPVYIDRQEYLRIINE